MVRVYVSVMIAACAIVTASCSKKPSSQQPSPGAEERISGSERIGWDQQAGDATELGTFRYAMYVDGTRSELSGVTCAAATAAFACTARLPAMTPGSHTLELASFVVDGGSVLESAKSPPLRVNVAVTSAVAPSDPGSRSDLGSTSYVASGFSRAITDTTIGAGNYTFVAERDGRINVVRDGHVDVEPALVLDDVDTRGGGGLLALATATDVARSGHIFAIYTTAGRDGRLAFRLARFRDVNGTLGERAILLDDIPAAPVVPRAILRFGPDGKLYVALDDGGDARTRADAASYNGKVLRLNLDGSVPRDERSAVFAEGLRSPLRLDWSSDGALWIVDSRDDGTVRLVRVAS
jgi:glucose/arabinose dehydrogenase